MEADHVGDLSPPVLADPAVPARAVTVDGHVFGASVAVTRWAVWVHVETETAHQAHVTVAPCQFVSGR